MLDAACSGVFHLLSDEPYVIQVAIVTGFHLFPFRTEKLSPSAPMVLHTRGRVGSRRFYERGANSSNACPLLFSFSESLESLEGLGKSLCIPELPACNSLTFKHLYPVFDSGTLFGPTFHEQGSCGIVYNII